MAVPNLGDLIVSSARRYITDNVADNVTNHNAILSRLKSKGQIKKASGGRSIIEPFIYGTNNSVQFYSGYDVFTPPTSDQKVFDGAEFQWKQCGGFLSWTGFEDRVNMGDYQNYDIIEQRVNQLQAQLNNTIAASMFSDGTGSNGKELTGLKLLVADDPTAAGTVGGIDQVANTFWRNKYYGSSTIGTISATTVAGFLQKAWLDTVRNKDKPDLIPCDQVWYQAYLSSLQSIQRIASTEVGMLGFQSLKFYDADVVYDYNCPAKHLYFLDTSSIFVRTTADRSMGFTMGEARLIQNADYKILPVFFMGNLTCNRRASNAVLISA